MSTDDPKATSWRDVYDLVRDTRADLMVAVGNVDTKVTDLGERVTGIEQDRRDEKIARQVEADLATERDTAARKRSNRLAAIATAGRGTIALIISAVAVLIAAFK